MEIWHQQKYCANAIEDVFVQINQSRSRRGVLRGLHYQVTQPQGKLVSVVQGKIFDVAVDLRRGSDTFGRWIGEYLSSQNSKQLWIPPGFAHGFLSLEEDSRVIYMCTDFYAPKHERTIQWNDPDIAIDWPLADIEVPMLSEKDANGLPLRRAETYP